MRIRYTGWGGIDVGGHRNSGDVFECPDREARILIAEGRAEEVPVTPEAAPSTQPRTADPAVRRKR